MTYSFSTEIAKERERQDAKWGEQSHPMSPDPAIFLVFASPQRRCEELEIPTEARAKFKTDNAAKKGELTWAHILQEELSEFVCAETLEDQKKEMIQIVACGLACLRDIEHKEKAALQTV